MFQFVQKELAPKAAEIDKTNNFADVKVMYITEISLHVYRRIVLEI